VLQRAWTSFLPLEELLEEFGGSALLGSTDVSLRPCVFFVLIAVAQIVDVLVRSLQPLRGVLPSFQPLG